MLQSSANTNTKQKSSIKDRKRLVLNNPLLHPQKLKERSLDQFQDHGPSTTVRASGTFKEVLYRIGDLPEGLLKCSFLVIIMIETCQSPIWALHPEALIPSTAMAICKTKVLSGPLWWSHLHLSVLQRIAWDMIVKHTADLFRIILLS